MRKHSTLLAFLLLLAGACLSPLVLLPTSGQVTSSYAGFIRKLTSDPSSPATGQVWLNTTTGLFNGYNGISTVNFGGVTGGTANRPALWSSSNTLTSDSGFSFAGTGSTFDLTVGRTMTAGGFTVSGTAGAGFLEFPAQSSTPAAPAGGFRFFADSSGRFSWRRASDGFVRTFDATLTANRVFTLPDASFTFAGIDINQTWTGVPTFSNGLTLGTSGNLFGGTNTVEQRNGSNAQRGRWFNTYTDASNGEWGGADWQATANSFSIGTFKNGTGATRALQFVVGNTNIANFSTSGHLLFNTDNTYDIGASGATRPRNLYVGGNGAFGSQVSVGQASGNALILTGTGGGIAIGSTGFINFSNSGNGAGTPVAGFTLASTSIIKVTDGSTGTGRLMTIGIRTGTASNTDLDGQLTLSGGTASYTFTGTYTSAPICIATNTSAATALQVTVTTTTLTVTGSGTDVVNYICHGRN